MTLVILGMRKDQGFLRRGQRERITPHHCQALWPQAKDQIKLLPTQEIGKIAAPMPMIAPLHLPSPELSFAGTSLKSTVMVEFSLQIIEELLLLCFRGPQVRCSELKH